jgi:hypothetical protein
MPSTPLNDLRAHYGAELPVSVPSGVTFICRRLDLHDLLFRRLLPLPLLAALSQVITEAKGDPSASVQDRMARSPLLPEFVDLIVCLSVCEPRVVMTRDEAGADALWVQVIALNDRSAIVEAVMPPGISKEAAQVTAASEFPAESAGAPVGSDGAAVPPAPIAVLIDGR